MASMPLMGLYLLGMCMVGSLVYSAGQSGAEGVKHSTFQYGQIIGLLHV